MLFFLLTTSFCVESGSYVMKLLKQSSSICVHDMDCDHGDEDGDGKCDKQFEKEFKEYANETSFEFKHPIFLNILHSNRFHHENENWLSHNFSRLDYSPPELLS